MKHVDSDPRHDEWAATREQLKSAQQRADRFTLLGLVVIGGLLWMNLDSIGPAADWLLASIALTLLVICIPLWYLMRRRRGISRTRLVCPHCGYVPHDTEISEVADTLRCQRCNQPLD